MGKLTTALLLASLFLGSATCTQAQPTQYGLPQARAEIEKRVPGAGEIRIVKIEELNGWWQVTAIFLGDRGLGLYQAIWEYYKDGHISTPSIWKIERR